MAALNEAGWLAGQIEREILTHSLASQSAAAPSAAAAAAAAEAGLSSERTDGRAARFGSELKSEAEPLEPERPTICSHQPARPQLAGSRAN